MRRMRSKSLALMVTVAFAVSMFALGVPAAGANGCPMSEVSYYPLYAGQDMLVGTVEVSNCIMHLHVKYMLSAEAIAEGWGIVETHTHVGLELEDFPMTKKGNPIPGQFEDSAYFDEPGVTMYEFIKPLDDSGVDDDVLVAAHAVVARAVEDCWETVWQIGDVETIDLSVGWLTNYADEFNWGDPAGPLTLGPSLAVEMPAYDDPFIVDVSDTSMFPYNSNAAKDYADDFDVQWAGALPYGGKLTFSWSPGISALETKELSLTGDGISPTLFQTTGTTVTGEGWFLDKYPLVEHTAMIDPLTMGDHTLTFKQLTGDGTFWDWVRLEKPCVERESAWAAQGEPGMLDFPGANWATYVTYTIKPVLVETVDVPATGASVGAGALMDGVDYVLKASGTYKFANWATTEYPELGYADAEYSMRPPGMPYSYHTELVPTWVSGDDIPTPYTSYLEVMLNGVDVDWGDFNSEHIYYADVLGDGSAPSFQILDTAYGDNSGHITVEIWAMP